MSWESQKDTERYEREIGRNLILVSGLKIEPERREV